MKIFKEKKYSILSGILKYSFVIVFGVTLVAPFIFAAGPAGGSAGPTGGTGGTEITNVIKNPLGEGGPQSIPEFIEALINIVLIVGIPIVALAIIYTGFLFVQAQGKPEQLTKAKNSLTYTLIGAALLLGAFVIAEAIGKTVEDIKRTT